MENLKFFALGGLGEVGKNMYVIEYKEKIFVFECGSAEPVNDVDGYDSIIADYSYLKNNIDRVQGVFLTRFGERTTGAFLRIIKDLKVPYFGGRFTIDAIKRRYLVKTNESEEVDFRVVEAGDVLDFDGVELNIFALTSNMPDTIGIALMVDVSKDPEIIEKKAVVFLPDFCFDQNIWGHFKTNFKHIAQIASLGTLALFCPSFGATKIGHVTTDGKLDLALRKIMSQKGRIFALMDAENVSGILQVIDAIYYQGRHVTIIGYKARRLVELAMELGYTRINNELYLKKETLNDEKRNSDESVIIIAGDQIDPYKSMQDIASYNDKHYALRHDDNIVLLLEVPKKYEKELAKTWNYVWYVEANIIDFDSKLMPIACAGSEDLKLVYSIFQPEYLIPISGDYRMIQAQKELAIDYGFHKENVIDVENGEVLILNDEGYNFAPEKIETKEILFGIELESDINNYVARERESLAQEGFAIVTGMINLKERKICDECEIKSSGFISDISKETVYGEIKKTFNEVVSNYLKQRKVDYRELRQDLKISISKTILRVTKKKPVLIPVIIDISASQEDGSLTDELSDEELQRLVTIETPIN